MEEVPWHRGEPPCRLRKDHINIDPLCIFYATLFLRFVLSTELRRKNFLIYNLNTNKDTKSV